jgi:hypothetical protein
MAQKQKLTPTVAMMAKAEGRLRFRQNSLLVLIVEVQAAHCQLIGDPEILPHLTKPILKIDLHFVAMYGARHPELSRHQKHWMTAKIQMQYLRRIWEKLNQNVGEIE